MDDDTTDSFLRTSRHVSVWIEAARCEVLFTVRRRAGMTEAQFDADAAAVAADLDTLRRLLED
jgi:hypothetical protein